MVTLAVLLTLAMIYQLIPTISKWMAICVTVFMATNYWFVKTTPHEVLTDIPFLFGSVLSLLGWEWLKVATETKSRVKATGFMVAGLAVAATMRPTFWILCSLGHLDMGLVSRLESKAAGNLRMLSGNSRAALSDLLGDQLTGPLHPSVVDMKRK